MEGNTDKAHEQWEKENRPEVWIEMQWGKIQMMMAELAEVLEAHPEIKTNIMEGVGYGDSVQEVSQNTETPQGDRDNGEDRWK